MPNSEIEGETSHSKFTASNESYIQSLGLPEDVQREIDEHIQNHGVKNLPELLKKHLNKHLSTPINVAVTGQTGSGKSSFINCVRNLHGDDDRAAAVGVTETTKRVKAYPDPQHPNIVYWDLPGIGTANFPREKYLELVDFKKYDFFLILSSERFKEGDLYLAESIRIMKKQFYFLRTKIDADLYNDKQVQPRKHDPKKVMMSVRKDCADNLKGRLPTDNIFIASTHLKYKANYDFPRLMETIVRTAPANKRLSLIFSLAACSEEIIGKKKADLMKRIPIVARMAPIDEIWAQTSDGRIVTEVNFYKDQFGLTKENLSKLDVDYRTLTEETRELFGAIGPVLLAIVRLFLPFTILPLSFFAYVTGFKKEMKMEIAKILEKALDRCAEAALEILSAGQGD